MNFFLKTKNTFKHTYQFHLAGLQTILNMHSSPHNYWEQPINYPEHFILMLWKVIFLTEMSKTKVISSLKECYDKSHILNQGPYA